MDKQGGQISPPQSCLNHYRFCRRHYSLVMLVHLVKRADSHAARSVAA